MITAHQVAELPEEQRRAFYAALEEDEAQALEFDWDFWARPAQQPPGSALGLPPTLWGGALGPLDWTVWAIIAGRGFGKTRTGAEFSIAKARSMPGSHGALVAATVDDGRKTMLSSGLEHMPDASGILKVSPPDFRPKYEPSKRILTWPNGTVATLYSAEEPDRLRGPQHHWGWVDEIAAWAHELEAWDQLLFGLRLGEVPQVCLTTTPRAVRILRELLKSRSTVVSRGRTRDNAANLSAVFMREIEAKFSGSRMGRQELEGELLEDTPGALWQLAMFERLGARLTAGYQAIKDQLRRVVVAVDPSGGSGKENDEQGIMVCGAFHGRDRHGVVLADRSCKLTPEGWGRRVVEAYQEFEADQIVYEANFGGDMCNLVIQAAARELGLPKVPTKELHASRGKQARAEPVATIYEQNRVAHLGIFPELEGELCGWVPNSGQRSPNRLDAMVWGITDLMLGAEVPGYKSPKGHAPRRI